MIKVRIYLKLYFKTRIEGSITVLIRFFLNES